MLTTKSHELSESSAGREFALHEIHLDLIPRISYSLLSTPGVIPESRAMSNP